MYGTPRKPRGQVRRSRWAPFWQILNEESTKRGLVQMLFSALAMATTWLGYREIPFDDLQPLVRPMVDVFIAAIELMAGGQFTAGFMGANRMDQDQ